MDSDLERFLVLWLCILTYDLPPTQTLDWNVALTATPGMLTIWHVLEAMARDLHVTTCLASLRSEDELSYIIYICVSLKRQSMELDIDSSTKVWYHYWREAESLKRTKGKTFQSFGDKLTGFAKK